MKKVAFSFIVLFLWVQGCKWRVEALPEEPFVFGFQNPAGFPPPTYPINTITEDGFKLGKALFYDKLLSKDNTVSCASCHGQASAFAHNQTLSPGINGLVGTRNSPAIINMAWNPTFFWDGRVQVLDLQAIHPIENPVEMAETMPNVVLKLQNSPIYSALFQKAYNSPEITPAKTMKALGQFMAMLVSANSKYDKSRRGEATLTPDEAIGLNIFRQKCGMCHTGELFTDNSFSNNGMPLNPPPVFNDQGRFSVTQLNTDLFKFKVPTVRNIEKTAPYMHDGRIATLEGAIAHYNFPANTPNVDPRLRQFPLGGLGIPLSPDERLKILAFLKTLTDEAFLTNPLFAKP